MKRKGRRFLGVMILLIFSLSAFAANNQSHAIFFIKKTKTLLAPKATKYEWFFNNVKINAGKQDLKVLRQGNYTVKTTDDEGNSEVLNIQVATNTEGELITIYTIGDSTVQSYNEGYYPRKGWGQILDYFFDENVSVINHGAGGTSALSFYRDLWSPIKNNLQPGDYVFIQFGINDANSDPLRRTEPFGSFQDYLTKFVEETQAKGAVPVLVATLRRNRFNSDGTVYDAYHDYPVATRQLAGELGVPLIDLDAKSKTLMELLGPDYVGPYWYMHLKPGEYPNWGSGSEDQVHFQETGALEMAKLIIEELQANNADTNIAKLIPHIAKQYPVDITTNFPEGGILTRDIELPAGVTVTVKGIMNEPYALNNYQDTAGNILTTDNIYFFTMDTMPATVYVELDDDPQFLDCAGKNYGTAFIDSCGYCVGGNTGKLPCYNGFSDSTYTIKPVHTNLCLQYSGSEIKQQNCTSNNNQLWTFELQPNGYYKIKDYNTGNYMNVSSTKDATNVTLSKSGSIWRIEEKEEGKYSFFPSGDVTKSANIVGGRTNPGDRVILWGHSGSDNEKFYITKAMNTDCNGDEWGTATEDICGICSGGNSGIEPITNKNNCPWEDCNGDLYGEATEDVCGICSGGNTGVEPITNVANCPVYIKSNEFENAIHVYPNPFKGNTTIIFNSEKNDAFSVAIFSLEGKQIFHQTNIIEEEIKIGSNLEKGIYFCKITSGTKSYNIKLVKAE